MVALAGDEPRREDLALNRRDVYTTEQETVAMVRSGTSPVPAKGLGQWKALMSVAPSNEESEIAKLLECVQFRIFVRWLFVGQTLAKRLEVEVTTDDQRRTRRYFSANGSYDL